MLKSSRNIKLWKVVFAITGGSLVAGLVSFIMSAGKGAIDTASDAAAGGAIGSALAVGLVVWATVYFIALRQASKRTKWLSFLTIAGFAIAGSSFAMTL